MKILNHPIQEFTFNDIVEFCKERHREGIQLDYKRELPKELAKLFAAFSNTRGGVIIIGVDEDKKPGLPHKWEGVENEGELIERIHQHAANVEPIPKYEVHPTDAHNGRVFILIRVFEGDQTPYYVHNDANLWVRTGNIRNPIDIASPDYAEILFGKKEKAQKARTLYLNQAQSIFEAAVQLEFGGKAISLDEAGICTVAVQPFFPREALIAPSDIPDLAGRIGIKDRDTGERFPVDGHQLNPIPEGVLHLYLLADSERIVLTANQLYSKGLLWFANNLLINRLNQTEQHQRQVFIRRIAINLYQVLKAATAYYWEVGYQGGVEGIITLKGASGAQALSIVSQRGTYSFSRPPIVFLNEYSWPFELSTGIMNDSVEFQDYYLDLIKRIHWDLGWKTIDDQVLMTFLEQNGWLERNENS